MTFALRMCAKFNEVGMTNFLELASPLIASLLKTVSNMQLPG